MNENRYLNEKKKLLVSFLASSIPPFSCSVLDLKYKQTIFTYELRQVKDS